MFTIERARPGRRVRGLCSRPTPTNQSRRRCTRYLFAGRFLHEAQAGSNRRKFSGKIGKKALGPGRYRATLIPSNGNGSGPQKRLTFTVVRR
jgi:hypothetical protein